MKRCPTVPVAPRTATVRLRMRFKSEASDRQRREPAPLRIEPAVQAQPGLRERGGYLLVAEDPGVLHAEAPVPLLARFVLNR